MTIQPPQPHRPYAPQPYPPQQQYGAAQPHQQAQVMGHATAESAQRYLQPYSPYPSQPYPPQAYPGQPAMPRREVTKDRRETRHGLHLVLTFCTLGFWAISGWPIAWMWNKFGPRRKTVTKYS